MDFKKYQHKLEFPTWPQKPYGRFSPSSVITQAYDKDLAQYRKQLPEYRRRAKAYHEEGRELIEQFKTDALEELGLSEHPKAELLYKMAWERDQAIGLREVFDTMDYLSKLLNKE